MRLFYNLTHFYIIKQNANKSQWGIVRHFAYKAIVHNLFKTKYDMKYLNKQILKLNLQLFGPSCCEQAYLGMLTRDRSIFSKQPALSEIVNKPVKDILNKLIIKPAC